MTPALSTLAMLAQSLDFLTVATNFGVAFCCLVALAVVVWRSLIWFGTNVAKPVADRHIKFLDELSTAMSSQAQAIQTMAVQQGKNIDGLDRLMTHVEELIRKQDEINRLIVQDTRATKGP